MLFILTTHSADKNKCLFCLLDTFGFVTSRSSIGVCGCRRLMDGHGADLKLEKNQILSVDEWQMFWFISRLSVSRLASTFSEFCMPGGKLWHLDVACRITATSACSAFNLLHRSKFNKSADVT